MAWLGVYVVTFNCARNIIQQDLFASHLFDVLPKSGPQSTDLPEILVLSLQEIAPIAYAFLGGSFLDPYFDAFCRSVNIAAGDQHYENIITKNVGMTAVMVFVRGDVAENISWIETAEVGVGVQEVGNKGAVGARFGYQIREDTVDLTFVAAHLAAGEWAVERRNEDWKNIAQKLVFSRVDNNGEKGAQAREGGNEEDFPLLQAESSTGERDYGLYSPRSKFPRPTEDISSHRHYSHLLAKDQLTQELREQRTLQDLSEAPITFLPTYKFVFPRHQAIPERQLTTWTWAKKRWPSWCDRVLYRNFPSAALTGQGGIEVQGYDALQISPTSDHRAVALSASVPLKPVSAPTIFLPPFDIDLNWERKRLVARRKEIVVGVVAYLGLTWEGNGLLLGSSLILIGSYFALQSFRAA
ncbi:hypothetical protein ACJ72_00994 [Emergomyces africanus]|uniref:Inositol polyphosphate-related phosphatase domain-containing protein n=1 Tax=Emergomyces africanus TaxID=1955775 RepID=A0A1B7P6H7_9EURO|nr:hypothetical protein ACJ72_00994 [Emergomyces africanus]